MESGRALLVVFGATGDLTRKKLIPAFATLLKEKILSKDSALIGVARSPYTDATFKKFVFDELVKEKKTLPKDLPIYYVSGDATQGLAGLKEKINQLDPQNTYQKIYYLATSYTLFPGIAKALKDANLHTNAKVVFEKPFGKNLETSNELDKGIHAIFDEQSIFRIDHYLGKETVQNINMLKFTNPVMESILTNQLIEKIEIIADETEGVGARLGYYEGVGAVRDMIQNHLLQILSLILMEQPKSWNPESIHDEKVKVLKSLKLLSSEKHLLGQYVNYANELKAKNLPVSKTETYARLLFESNLPRWKNIPIIIRTGKMLEKKYGEIIITFKKSKDMGIQNVSQNKLSIQIQPEENIYFALNSTDLQKQNTVQLVNFEFCKVCYFGPNSPDAYKVLLEEILKGDKTLFTRSDEIKESWNIISSFDKIQSKISFITYLEGTDPEMVKR